MRFIPAGAGNTPSSPSSHLPAAVYPRWRGEHLAGTPGDIDNGGLSPLARGTPGKRHTEGLRDRFIPLAQEHSMTNNQLTSTHGLSRWRGEHRSKSTNKFAARGLSPLARGTLTRICRSGLKRRFIPAGAGEHGDLLNLPLVLTVYIRWRGGTRGEFPVETPGYRGLSRWRGEHEELTHRYNVRHGLHPRWRGGTLVSPPHRKRWCRFIRWRGEHFIRNTQQ